MHVANITQVLLPPRFCADSFLPTVYDFQDTRHNGAREWWRAFGEATNKFVEEFFGGYLEMEGISARLDESLEEGKGEEGDVGIPVIRKAGYEHRCFTGCIGFLSVDVFSDFEMVGKVWLMSRGVTGIGDEDFKPRCFEPGRRCLS